MAYAIKNAQWRLGVNAAGFLGAVLIRRDKLLPDDVVALYMDKMNDPHPQMRSTAQNRMMLVRPPRPALIPVFPFIVQQRLGAVGGGIMASGHTFS